MAVPKSVDELIISSLSFEQLDDDSRQKVLRCASMCQDQSQLKVWERTWPIDARQLLLNRQNLPQALARAKHFVSTVEPLGFQELDDVDAQYYQEELSLAFYVALADCELAALEHRDNLASKRDYLLHIGGLLAQLRNRDLKNQDSVHSILPHDRDDPTRYFGMLLIAPQITEIVKKVSIDSMSSMIDYPASLNDGRLYLVWMTELLGQICSNLRGSIRYISFYTMDAILNGISFVTGSMGWVLYFLRGSINTAFLFEVTKEVRVLNLSQSETSAYFYGKWHEKRFSILNDVAWGIVNCVCFFILTGNNMLGYYGNALNAVLFVFDFGLCLWQFSEAEAAHEAMLLDYDQQIQSLSDKLASNSDETRERVLRRRLQLLQEERQINDRSWRYQLQQLRLDAIYAANVLIAFSVLCSFFIPPVMVVPLSTVMCGMVGSAMCFGLGIVHSAWSSSLDISKTSEDARDIEEIFKEHVILFRHTSDEKMKRMIFLDLRHAVVQMDEQKRLIQYQRADMICSMMTDILLPVMMFSAFVLMPMSFGLSAFVLGLVIILIAKCYVAELAPADVRDESIPLTLLTQFSSFFKKGFGLKSPAPLLPKTQSLYLPASFPEKAYQGFCRASDQEKDLDVLKRYLIPEPQHNILGKPGSPYPDAG